MNGPSTLSERFEKKAYNLLNCNTLYFLDKYEKSKIKDLKHTFFCKNPFCNTCKKMKQAIRTFKFKPYLEEVKDKLYHLTLTVPNCSGDDLKNVVNNMTSSFQKLIRYFRCNTKIADLDFSKYKFLGALRSFEVTFKNDDYHPHFHVAIAFEKLALDKHIINQYSYKQINNFDKSNCNISFKFGKKYYYLSDYFSEFEILIQKIWYLLINKMKVTKSSIDKLELGYACMIKEFKPDDYIEIFKYMTKGTSEAKNKDGEEIEITYNQFDILEKSLYKLRQIQGYGIFYNLKDVDVTDQELKECINDYDDFIKSLNEKPIPGMDSLDNLMVESNYKIISKNRFLEEERKEIIKEKFNIKLKGNTL